MQQKNIHRMFRSSLVWIPVAQESKIGLCTHGGGGVAYLPITPLSFTATLIMGREFFYVHWLRVPCLVSVMWWGEVCVGLFGHDTIKGKFGGQKRLASSFQKQQSKPWHDIHHAWTMILHTLDHEQILSSHCGLSITLVKVNLDSRTFLIFISLWILFCPSGSYCWWFWFASCCISVGK